MGHHVAQSLPTESDTGLSAKKLMDEGTLQAYTLEEVRRMRSAAGLLTTAPQLLGPPHEALRHCPLSSAIMPSSCCACVQVHADTWAPT